MGVLAVWKKKSRLKGEWDVAEKAEVDEDAGSSKEMGEAEEEGVKVVGSDERTSEQSEGLVRVQLEGADEEVGTGVERTVLDEIVVERLQDGYFESGDCLSAVGCCHGVKEGGRR